MVIGMNIITRNEKYKYNIQQFTNEFHNTSFMDVLCHIIVYITQLNLRFSFIHSKLRFSFMHSKLRLYFMYSQLRLYF